MPKLERFNKKSDKPTTKHMMIASGIIVGILGIFVAYKSFAFYTDKQAHDVIKAKIGEYRYDYNVSYDNTNTGLNCTGNNANVKCAIDEIADMLGE